MTCRAVSVSPSAGIGRSGSGPGHRGGGNCCGLDGHRESASGAYGDDAFGIGGHFEFSANCAPGGDRAIRVKPLYYIYLWEPNILIYKPTAACRKAFYAAPWDPGVLEHPRSFSCAYGGSIVWHDPV